MHIKEEPYVEVTIKAICDLCGEELQKEDISYMYFDTGFKRHKSGFQRHFRYTCPKCNVTIDSDKDYPLTEFRKVKHPSDQ